MPREARGLPVPNTFPVPDEVVDYWMPRLSHSAFKVLLYIVRRTLGFYKERDPISYSQFLNGIVTREGKRLDSGTGLSRGGLRKALDELEAAGLVQVERRETESGDPDISIYSIAWRGGLQNRPPGTLSRPQAGHSVDEGRTPHRPDAVYSVDQQRTDQDTDSQEDPTFDAIVKKAAVGLNRWPKRADVAGELGKLVSAIGPTPAALSRAVDRALAVRQKGDSPDTFYLELIRLLEIAPS